MYQNYQLICCIKHVRIVQLNVFCSDLDISFHQIFSFFWWISHLKVLSEFRLNSFFCEELKLVTTILVFYMSYYVSKCAILWQNALHFQDLHTLVAHFCCTHLCTNLPIFLHNYTLTWLLWSYPSICFSRAERSKHGKENHQCQLDIFASHSNLSSWEIYQVSWPITLGRS